MSALRFVIAGGGTGGHVLPGIAVARELHDHFGAEVRFFGTARGMETKLVPAAGFALDLIASGPLNRVSLSQRTRSLFAIPHGVVQSMRLLRASRADAVLSVGGYAAGPVMLAAHLLRIPSVVFEPNAVPGRTNRIAGKWARASAVNFVEAGKYLPRAEVTGIPVRAEFFSVQAFFPQVAPHLLVFGGSQGAQIFNAMLPTVASALLSSIPGLTILHQTGAGRAEVVRRAYEMQGLSEKRVRVVEFIPNMAEEFAQASVVMARSGASTVAELAAAGRAALLVPFAAAADDHQQKNADAFAEDGAARVLREQQFTAESIEEVLPRLMNDPSALAEMAHAARNQAKPGAARRIAELLVNSARIAAG